MTVPGECILPTGCSEVGEEGELAVYNPRGGPRKLYKFDKVFGCDSTQEEVYEDTKALIRSVLDGAPLFFNHQRPPHAQRLS